MLIMDALTESQQEQKEEEEKKQQDHNHNRRRNLDKEELGEDEEDDDSMGGDDEQTYSDGALSDTEDYFDSRGATDPSYIKKVNIVNKWWRFDKIVAHRWIANKLMFKVQWTRTLIYPHETRHWKDKFKDEIAEIDAESETKSYVYWLPEWIATSQFCDGRMNQVLKEYGHEQELLIM